MRRGQLAVSTIAAVVMLSACGGSSVDPNSVTCSQINGDKNGIVETVGDQLAKKIPGGGGNPNAAGELSADLTAECFSPNGQPNGSSSPAQQAFAKYKQDHGIQ